MYYPVIDYHIREKIRDLGDPFAESAMVPFMREYRPEVAALWQTFLSRFLTLLGLVIMPLTLELAGTRFSLQPTLFMLFLALVFVTIFIYLDHATLLTWTLALIGVPALVVWANVHFSPIALVDFVLIQLGLITSPLSRYEQSALHLILLWQFGVCLTVFMLTQQFVFFLGILLAFMSGLRVYGVMKTLKLVLILGIFAVLLVAFWDIGLARLILFMVAPYVLFTYL